MGGKKLVAIESLAQIFRRRNLRTLLESSRRRQLFRYSSLEQTFVIVSKLLLSSSSLLEVSRSRLLRRMRMEMEGKKSGGREERSSRDSAVDGRRNRRRLKGEIGTKKPLYGCNLKSSTRVLIETTYFGNPTAAIRVRP